MIVTFCGHSDYKESKQDEERIIALLEEFVGDQPAELFLGGYGAFDAFARRCGKEFQKTHPHTRLIFVTPYITEAYQKTHLDYAKSDYDEIVYPPIEHVPLKFAVSHRNKWMVEQADLLIACVRHRFGGAYQTYLHAKRKGKRIENIADAESESSPPPLRPQLIKASPV